MDVSSFSCTDKSTGDLGAGVQTMFLPAARTNAESSRNDSATRLLPSEQTLPEETMKKLAISLAVGASALFATAAYATPLSNGIVALPDSNIENVRMVCNENGRCWRERGERRVIIRERDSYDYAPRERYIERRGYYDEPRAGVGFSAPGVSVGVGVGNDRW
jgi:hypothetical protein